MSITLTPLLGWIGFALVALIILGFLGAMTVTFVHSQGRSDITLAMVLRRWIIGLCLIGIFLTPSTHTLTTTRAVSATDVFIAVDVTGSMAVQDAAYGDETAITRIRAARNAIYDIAEKYPDASFTGINFGSSSSVALPSTPDTYALENWADTLTTEPTNTSAGSSLDQPLNTLTTRMKETKESHPDDTIVLYYISDAESTSGEAIKSFSVLRAYVKNNDSFVITVGSEQGDKIPNTSHGISANEVSPSVTSWVQDPDTGQDGISRMDGSNAKTIADQLSGHSIAVNSSTTIKNSVDTSSSTQYRITTTTRNSTRTQPIIWPFAVLALIITVWELIAWLLTSRKLMAL